MSDDSSHSSFDLDDVRDAEVRRVLFARHLDSVFTEADHVRRRNLAIKAMESAFRAGVENGRWFGGFRIDDTETVSLTERDLGSRAQSALRAFRLALFDGISPSLYKSKPTPEDLVTFFRPSLEAQAPSYGRDGWIMPSNRSHLIGVKSMEPLLKLGLFDEMRPAGALRCALLNEWGYEMTKHGRTSYPELREPGMSRTYEEWRSLLQVDPEPWVRAAIKLRLCRNVAGYQALLP